MFLFLPFLRCFLPHCPSCIAGSDGPADATPLYYTQQHTMEKPELFYTKICDRNL